METSDASGAGNRAGGRDVRSFGRARGAMRRGGIAVVLLVLGCTPSDSDQDEVVPTGGELFVRNNTADSICHVIVHPVTHPSQQFDLIERRDENLIKPHSLRRFLQGNEPALNVQSPYKIEAESCTGSTSSEFEFSWSVGAIFTVENW